MRVLDDLRFIQIRTAAAKEDNTQLGFGRFDFDCVGGYDLSLNSIVHSFLLVW